METKVKFILLDPEDNVLICCLRTEAGQVIEIDEEKVTLTENIDLGHKIARQNLTKGNKVIKYGVAIGSILHDIKLGEHIHLHNMKSDYIPPHTRDRLQEVDEYK